ncbi:WD40-repeat-containing domain protein [Pisolithus croceorrhizus]|nr:WD40-repeat-containing domain protein [Pisolithus croceorrhizus]
MFSAIFMRSPQHYRNVASFTTCAASVHALALSNDGNILASRGTDGIKLWNIKSCRELTCANHKSYGAISCVTWIKTKHSSMETLCYGTGMGYLVFMRPNPVDMRTGLEITCVAWDASWIDAGVQIAIGMHDNVVQVLLLNSNSQLQSVFAGWLEHTVPKSVTFTQCRNIYIFSLYDGNVVKMNATDGIILSEHCYDSVIGCAVVSLKKELIVIDNAMNGFTLYLLDHEDLIQYFVTEPQSVPIPKQVVFREESKIIVGGSDNGSVYLFERRTGQMLAKLTHSKMGLVQTITVHRDIFAFFLP